MAKQRGNPNWGKPEPVVMATPTLTEFEQMVRKLELKPNEYVNSKPLREWAERHRHSKYVPESLLTTWSFGVAVTL